MIVRSTSTFVNFPLICSTFSFFVNSFFEFVQINFVDVCKIMCTVSPSMYMRIIYHAPPRQTTITFSAPTLLYTFPHTSKTLSLKFSIKIPAKNATFCESGIKGRIPRRPLANSFIYYGKSACLYTRLDVTEAGGRNEGLSPYKGKRD